MLILDTPTQQTWKQAFVVERTRQLTSKGLADKLLRDSELLYPDGTVDVTCAEAQTGNELSIEDFKARLTRSNRNFLFEKSIAYPEIMGIYMMRQENSWETKKVKQYIVGFNWFPRVAEFTTVLYKESQHPKCDGTGEWETRREMTDIKSGWRRVLALLLHKGLLTASDVYREFPSCTRDSKNWKLATT